MILCPEVPVDMLAANVSKLDQESLIGEMCSEFDSNRGRYTMPASCVHSPDANASQAMLRRDGRTFYVMATPAFEI